MLELFTSIVRQCLIIVNLLVLALAAILIYASLVYNEPNCAVCFYLAGLGIVVTVMSLFGLHGAARQSKGSLGIHAILVFIMISCITVLVVFSYSINDKDKVFQQLDSSVINSTLASYNFVDSGDTQTKVIDYLQRHFACCGLDSPNDWTEYAYHKIPKSCCSEPVESSLPVFKYCAESDYKNGCFKILVSYFFELIHSVRQVLFATLAAETVCLFGSLFMIRSLKKKLDVV